MAERLHKLLASAGFGSRREIERWIEEGRIMLNGVIAKRGDCATDQDEISIDGRRLPTRQISAPQRRVIAYYKPEGEITTRKDPEGRPTIFENLPRITQGRWITVGRLDINTSGLLLLTTDGELANRLMHPSHAVQREYAARVLGEVDAEILRTLLRGVELEDGLARFESIADAGGSGANHWYHVTLSEGRNREVRRLWETQGVKVSRLIRVRYGPMTLPRRLRPGRWQELTDEELAPLLEMVDLPAESSTAVATPRRRTTTAHGNAPHRKLAPARDKAAQRSAAAPGKPPRRVVTSASSQTPHGSAAAIHGKAVRRSSAATPVKTPHRVTSVTTSKSPSRDSAMSAKALHRNVTTVASKAPQRSRPTAANRTPTGSRKK